MNTFINFPPPNAPKTIIFTKLIPLVDKSQNEHFSSMGGSAYLVVDSVLSNADQYKYQNARLSVFNYLFKVSQKFLKEKN